MASEIDLLGQVIARLATVKVEMGEQVYRDAVRRALTSIARAALEEAESRTSRKVQEKGNVVRFPVRRTRDLET